jgi:hypothetical protein
MIRRLYFIRPPFIYTPIKFVYYSTFNLETHFCHIICLSQTDNASEMNLIPPVEFNRVCLNYIQHKHVV